LRGIKGIAVEAKHGFGQNRVLKLLHEIYSAKEARVMLKSAEENS